MTKSLVPVYFEEVSLVVGQSTSVFSRLAIFGGKYLLATQNLTEGASVEFGRKSL